MIPAVTHHKTLTLEGKTWVYYRCNTWDNLDFNPLIDWIATECKGLAVFGTAERLGSNSWQMPFVFDNKDDAMRFKLSF